MATTVLDAYSKAYPSISLRIRAAVFSESDPLAVVASIIDAVSGHPSRIWHFPGLPRDNYKFSLDVIDADGNPIQNLALFDVVPGAIEGLLVRKDEQPQVDITTGMVAGATNFVFDGTGGKPDYIGWDIVPSELTGRGILVRGLDYSWDSTTGTFALLQSGDVLATLQYYNVHFEPQAQQNVPDSVPTVNDFDSRVVTTTQTLLTGDFGKSIIIEPAGSYIELTLPDIDTVPRGRILSLEMSPAKGKADLCCVKILTVGGNVINFMEGDLYMMSNESLQIYKLRREDLSTEYRVRYPDGNFRNAGESVSDDSIQTGVYNKHLYDGAIETVAQYARIYNNYVLKLPAAQQVNYDDWATGNNNRFYSKANSANPANAGKFHFPQRLGLFERNNQAGKSGDYSADSVKISGLSVKITLGNSFTGAPGSDWLAVAPRMGRGLATPNDYSLAVDNGGVSVTETQPKNYLINKYALV